ncbi:MAG: hypothetical protein H6Q58_780 [Firmicutes bacterium]|nr:hypothetical protein [Bacillota bacterium]
MKKTVTLTFLIMVGVNALANILPIGGQNTGQVSDSYPNLFAPAGITFSIWGLIYLLLAGYTVYQLELFQKEKSILREGLLTKVGVLFSISSAANSIWIFSWHYEILPASMMLMLVILFCLILINQILRKENLPASEKIFVRLPFSVYFGWITVATIANATTLLVSTGFDGLGLTEAAWTVIMISAGAVIGIATMLRNKDIPYGLVIIWAYAGIIIKHTSAAGFNGQYPQVITAAWVCIALLVIAGAYTLKRGGNYAV